MGLRGRGRGHRQRRLDGPLRHERRRQPPLSQQWQRHVHRRGRAHGRRRGRLVDRRELRRLRWRWTARPVRRRLRGHGSGATAGGWPALPVPRRAGDVRPARAGRGTRPVVPERGRAVRRRHGESGCPRRRRLLRVRGGLGGRGRRQRCRPARRQRFNAQFPVPEHGQGHVRGGRLLRRLRGQRGRPRTGRHGAGAGRLRQRRPARQLHHQLLGRFQHDAAQSRRGAVRGRHRAARPADALAAVSRVGHRLSRFRQRRVARSVRRQRPRLSAGGPLRLGNDVGAAPAAVPQSRRGAVRRGSGGAGKRAGGRPIGPRRRLRRSRSRRPHRHRRQQSGPRPDAAQERRTGWTLDFHRPGRGRRRAARCDWRRRDGGVGRAPAEAGCRQRRQLLLPERSARAFRAGRNRPGGPHHRPMAGWQPGSVHRSRRGPEADVDERTGRIQKP